MAVDENVVCSLDESRSITYLLRGVHLVCKSDLFSTEPYM
jgi:hypothetical protein